MAKKAMVTGASEGIGREFALQLLRQGYEVTGVARNTSKLAALEAESNGKLAKIVADLSTPEGQRQAADELGRVHYDLLINNAGVGLTAPFTTASLPSTLAMMHLNCDAVVTLAHAFLAQARQGDALVNVSSTLAFLPCPTLSTYAATKAFVLAFSEALWYEQRARGVFVQCLCPGVTLTNFHVNSGARNEDTPRALAQTAEQVVATALRALAARSKPTLITGWKNRVFSSLFRFLPRRAAPVVMGNAMKPRPD